MSGKNQSSIAIHYLYPMKTLTVYMLSNKHVNAHACMHVYTLANMRAYADQ